MGYRGVITTMDAELELLYLIKANLLSKTATTRLYVRTTTYFNGHTPAISDGKIIPWYFCGTSTFSTAMSNSVYVCIED